MNVLLIFCTEIKDIFPQIEFQNFHDFCQLKICLHFQYSSQVSLFKKSIYISWINHLAWIENTFFKARWLYGLQWVENYPTNIHVFPTNICTFLSSWYYTDGFCRCWQMLVGLVSHHPLACLILFQNELCDKNFSYSFSCPDISDEEKHIFSHRHLPYRRWRSAKPLGGRQSFKVLIRCVALGDIVLKAIISGMTAWP
jgi:hypothetical protein